MTQGDEAKEFSIERYVPQEEPFYLDVNGETGIFRAAHREKIPVMLKGPTGCGKSRFVEHMAYVLGQETEREFPLVTIPCHEDLNADDLKGRHLLNGQYQEGPALVAVRNGGILYLDEIVEARNDTTVVVHPLADHRRSLFIEKLGKVYEAPDSFMLVVSYNPGYQRKVKDLKQSTKQRFAAIDMGYPSEDIERKVIMHEADVEENIAAYLTDIGQRVRNLKGKGLDEGASTRLLIHAGKLIREGVAPLRACEVGILDPITDDLEVYGDLRKGLADVVRNYFPED
jgi:nitric oxide reductase NorQ protein